MEPREVPTGCSWWAVSAVCGRPSTLRRALATLTHGLYTGLLMNCFDAAAGCVTTECNKYGWGEVTVTNTFGASIDYIAAEYTNNYGHKVCDKSKCAFLQCAVAALPPVPH